VIGDFGIRSFSAFWTIHKCCTVVGSREKQLF
jgi:hypothetical protein